MGTLAEQAARLKPRAGAAPRGKRIRPGVALMTDRARLPDPLPLLDRLPAGSLVVLREPDARTRRARAKALAIACRARRLTLMIAGDVDLAIMLKAGLHLPEAQARVAGARVRLWHRRMGRTLTVAAHGRRALARAALLSADAAFLSPLFPTASHPGARPLGILRFRVLVRDARVPVWALGGVDDETIRCLRGSGAVGIAAIGGLSR